jgi:DNA-binding NarL/FixJ family response regulator
VPPSSTSNAELRLLVVTNRPAIEHFFAGLAARDPAGALTRFVIATVRPGHGAVDKAATLLPRIDVAVIDPALDATASLHLCHELRKRRANLPMLLVVCCPGSVSPWRLRTLLSGGMSGVLDLEADHDGVARAIRNLSEGLSVLRLQVAPDNGLFLGGLLGNGEQAGVAREIKDADVNLLSLLTQGFSNREIGRSLKLSPHTIKHYLEHLREAIGARNRVELAAWAARQGFYQPSQV